MARPALPVPTWALLGALVLLSFMFRFHWAIRDPAPWIFSDELHYWEPAKALAYTGRPAIREVPGTGGFGIMYPALLAPAFLLFDRLPDAYDAVKAINSLLMSLTVFPVFLLARRFAGRGLALAAAALSVAVPSLTYTGNVMVENAFYPLTALWLLALVRVLERPTLLRQVVVVALALAAMLTKVQAVTLIPAMVTAIGIVALLDALAAGRAGALRRLAAGVARFWPMWGLFALAVPVAVVRQLLRDQPLRELLGAYAAVLDRDYTVNAVAQWGVFHVAALDITLGFFPFAAFLLMTLWGLRPRAPRSLRIFSAVGLGTVLWFLVVVSAFATTPTVERILERNLFHVAPLFFVALVAWIAHGAPRPWWAVAPAALFAGTLTLALPINSFLNTTLVHSTPGLLPLWRWRDRLFSPGSIDNVVAVAAILAAVLFVLVPRKWLAPLTIGLLAFYVGAAARPVEGFTHQASEDASLTIRSTRDWIDQAVGMKADVASFYWSGDQFRFWEAEYFNRSVGPVYSVPGPYDGLPGLIPVSVDRSGLVRDPAGAPVTTEYVVTDDGTQVAGQRVPAQHAFGMGLFRVNGRLVVRQRVDGLFADRWSGPVVYYSRFGCRGGALVARLTSAANVHRRAIVVTASPEGGVPRTAAVRPAGAAAVLRVPLRPKNGVCTVTFAVPTAFSDGRALGALFGFTYEPPA
jgi:Dolichyl-phosphate-mannose-protein mannosyltransferase